MKQEIELSKIINHLKSSGYIFQGSEIYGGIANTFDYGPLGSLLKNNLKNLWIKRFITQQSSSFLIDCSIFMNSNVWKASGHLDNFIDISIDCKECKKRIRVDHLIENFFNDAKKQLPKINYNDHLEIINLIKKHKIKCPYCGKFHWSEPKNFNLILNTNLDITNPKGNIVYLRPETAQGIFVNFNNIILSSRPKLPFAVGQIGKSFRNEVTPGNFIFRTKEFEQMELEIFCYEEEANKIFTKYEDKIYGFLTNDIQLNKNNLRIYKHPKEKLAHYSNATIDFEYNFPFGWNELWGLANRGNYDLLQHSKYSNSKLLYLDPKTNSKITPYIIEPSVGVDRLILSILCDAYNIEKIENDSNSERIILKLANKLAPYIACICPLSKELEVKSKEIYNNLLENFSVTYDGAGSIGKRYRRQDAIGTPLCITIDFDTDKDHKVTIRNRDSMKQERVEIKNLDNYIFNILK